MVVVRFDPGLRALMCEKCEANALYNHPLGHHRSKVAPLDESSPVTPQCLAIQTNCSPPVIGAISMSSLGCSVVAPSNLILGSFENNGASRNVAHKSIRLLHKLQAYLSPFSNREQQTQTERDRYIGISRLCSIGCLNSCLPLLDVWICSLCEFFLQNRLVLIGSILYMQCQ